MMMKMSGRVDMSFLPAGIHTPAKPDFKNSCVDLTAPRPPLWLLHTKTRIHTHASTHLHVHTRMSLHAHRNTQTGATF